MQDLHHSTGFRLKSRIKCCKFQDECIDDLKRQNPKMSRFLNTYKRRKSG